MTTHPPSVTERAEEMKEAERGRESMGGGGRRHSAAQVPLFMIVTETQRGGMRRHEPIRLEQPLPGQKSQR